jgi:hypothetical protein
MRGKMEEWKDGILEEWVKEEGIVFSQSSIIPISQYVQRLIKEGKIG